MRSYASALSMALIAVCAASCDKNAAPIAQSAENRASTSVSTQARLRFEPLFAPEEDESESLHRLTMRTPQDCMDLVDAEQSLEVGFDGSRYLFCTSAPRPLYQSVGMDIHGWIRFPGAKTWVRMFSVRTHWAFDVRLVFDKKTGVFTAECCANNNNFGQPVVSFDVSYF